MKLSRWLSFGVLKTSAAMKYTKTKTVVRKGFSFPRFVIVLSARSLVYEKKDPSHQTFPAAVYENKILVQNCLGSEWTLNEKLFWLLFVVVVVDPFLYILVFC